MILENNNSSPTKVTPPLVQMIPSGLKIFNKEHHEEINDYLLTELAVREHRLETLIRHLDQKLKRSSKKHEFNKEKAA